MKRASSQSGFTAVELLITLFVAAAFLIASYQLFNVVIKDGGQARAESKAGSVAYDYMRRYSSSAAAPCIQLQPVNNLPITVDGLSNVTISVTITCPTFNAADMSKVEVAILYNTPQQTVKYATYVSGNSSAATAVTSGLVDQWTFNGSASNETGTAIGSTTNASLVTGQDGRTNGAYSLNGTNAYISLPMTNLPTSMNAVTFSFWAKPTSATPSAVLFVNTDETNNRLAVHIPYTANNMYFDFGNTTTTGRLSGTFSNSWYNAWALWTFTADPTNGMKIYRDTQLVASQAGASTFTKGARTLEIGRVYNNGTYWAGSIDDLRIYSRELTLAEIQAIFSGRAQ